MEEIYLIAWCSNSDVHQIMGACSTKEEALKYIEQSYPSYEYDDYFDEQWHNTMALDPDEDYLYLIKTKFIK